MRPSWEEIAKELQTATWLLKDCVRRSAKYRVKRLGKRRRKRGERLLIRIVLNCHRGQCLAGCSSAGAVNGEDVQP